MSLPHELLDEIFSYLPLGDGIRYLHSEYEGSLRACSLVERSWVSPARRRLFSFIAFTGENSRSWKDRISVTNTELFSHVRSLRFFAPWEFVNWYHLPINDFFEYLPSFHHLQHLTLRNMRIGSDISERLEVLSAFRHTLSSLTFEHLVLAWSAFIAIVDYFPGVGDLVVDRPTWETSDQQTPPLSRPLHGRLSIRVYRDFPTFPDRLSGLEVEYDELLILGASDPNPAYQRIVDTCGKSLKRLRLSHCVLGSPSYQAQTDPLTLEHCPELCRLEILKNLPKERAQTIISSLTSINLRTIAFLADPYGKRFTSYILARPGYWLRLEDTLCRLVEKLRTLGYKHTLELEFHLEEGEATNRNLDYTGLLEKFREEGRVRIFGMPRGGVVGEDVVNLPMTKGVAIGQQE